MTAINIFLVAMSALFIGALCFAARRSASKKKHVGGTSSPNRRERPF
jgi:hypothetical protein